MPTNIGTETARQTPIPGAAGRYLTGSDEVRQENENFVPAHPNEMVEVDRCCGKLIPCALSLPTLGYSSTPRREKQKKASGNGMRKTRPSSSPTMHPRCQSLQTLFPKPSKLPLVPSVFAQQTHTHTYTHNATAPVSHPVIYLNRKHALFCSLPLKSH